MTTRTMIICGALILSCAAAPVYAVVGDCDDSGDVTVDEIVRAVNIALEMQPVSTCAAADVNGDGQVTVDELVAAVRVAIDGAPEGRAFVVATDFQTGSFATITLDPPRTVVGANAGRHVGSDATPRVYRNKIYVVNRFGSDSVQEIDPSAGFATVKSCSTGAGSNPNDIAFASPSKAYVPLYARAQLLVVDPSVGSNCTAFVRGSIDLSSYADADGIPEMAQAVVVGRRAYVSLQRLTNFVAGKPGLLVVIDTDTDEVVDSIELTGSDPFAETKGLTVRDGSILVSDVGLFGVNDGGIERVDLTTGASAGYVVTEAQAGGDITDFVYASDTLVYLIISKADFSTALIAYDLGTQQVTQTLAAGNIADIEINSRGELFASDRTIGASGVRIFRASDGTALLANPLDTGLPPFDIVFVP